MSRRDSSRLRALSSPGVTSFVGASCASLHQGGESPTVRQELQAIEAALAGLRIELADIDRSDGLALPRVHPSWILAKLAQLQALVASNVVRAL